MQEGGRLRENDRVRQEKLRGEIKKKGKLRDSPRGSRTSHRATEMSGVKQTLVYTCTQMYGEKWLCIHVYIHLRRERELGRVQKRNVKFGKN